jgi:hypothetical protein
MADATFEDGAENPLRLQAMSPEDLAILSALVQDAVFPASEMKWRRRSRDFAILLNRFRWEDKTSAEKRSRPYERVQSILLVTDVAKVASQGVDRGDADTVLSVLSLSWEPADDGTGRLTLTLAGDGAVAVDVECLDVTLADVTRPYAAPSGKAPDHEPDVAG